MSRLISIDPSSIQSMSDFERIRPCLGQTKSFFLAQTPKSWLNLLKSNIEKFNQNDQKKINEFFVWLQNENNSIFRVNYKDRTDDFIQNAIDHLNLDFRLKLVIARKSIPKYKIKTFSDITDEELDGPESFHGKFNPDAVWSFLELYAKTAGRLAIVSRHNNLFDSANNPSKFSRHLCNLVQGVAGSGCHEIIIYSERRLKDGKNFNSEQDSDESLKSGLAHILMGKKLPTYGVRLIVCDEHAAYRNTDLHERLIVTNHVVLRLTDDLGGGAKTQSISVEPDLKISKLLRSRWLDGAHGLTIYRDVRIENHK